MTSELTTLSSSLALVSGVGETLEKAEQLKQQAIELSHKSETVASELEQYQAEVEECVKAKHYQATSLKLLAKSLHEKRGSVSSSVEDKLTLVTAAVEFHLDVKNVRIHFIAFISSRSAFGNTFTTTCSLSCMISYFYIIM